MDGQPDEDGWITVTRHGRKKVTPRTEAINQKAIAKEKKKKKERVTKVI